MVLVFAMAVFSVIGKNQGFSPDLLDLPRLSATHHLLPSGPRLPWKMCRLKCC